MCVIISMGQFIYNSRVRVISSFSSYYSYDERCRVYTEVVDKFPSFNINYQDVEKDEEWKKCNV